VVQAKISIAVAAGSYSVDAGLLCNSRLHVVKPTQDGLLSSDRPTPGDNRRRDPSNW